MLTLQALPDYFRFAGQPKVAFRNHWPLPILHRMTTKLLVIKWGTIGFGTSG
jgi:hypothetical protein